MDFLSGLAKRGQSKPTSDEPNQTSDLFGSAKVVAEAAQAQFTNAPEKYDNAKVAGASADILDAAGKYGKLDENQGVGKYVEQAEGYLRQYNAPTAPAGDFAGEKTAAAVDSVTGIETEKPDAGAEDYIKKTEGFLDKPSDDNEGGGVGDYSKKEEGFLNKPSDDSEGADIGGYTKKAEGFLNKPSYKGEGDDVSNFNKNDEGSLDKPSDEGREGGASDYIKKNEEFLSKPSDDGEDKGVGDYTEKPEGFLNKPSDEGEEDGGSDYIKKAEGFLNKPSDGGEGAYIKKAEGGAATEGENSQPPSESEGGYGNLVKKAGGFFNN